MMPAESDAEEGNSGRRKSWGKKGIGKSEGTGRKSAVEIKTVQDNED